MCKTWVQDSPDNVPVARVATNILSCINNKLPLHVYGRTINYVEMPPEAWSRDPAVRDTVYLHPSLPRVLLMVMHAMIGDVPAAKDEVSRLCTYNVQSNVSKPGQRMLADWLAQEKTQAL